ncbi:MAG: disulfide bond formation protein B [Pseudotabrizicola sp.]|uniref:disulfide bond formation protein B n=1 Tax=Pseudotabrizicola sp. TaxID=2939647 RepID=UPI00272FC1B4|nr:disulfide bond formation protein B [Pseudotabrizicola sp.]MDP2082825.1 disulfide bond formation protein B [Pseudotabrizicola sp.]MDZ7576202.1 disulfide bond formation protein B [Pseudotabrizicola sp.]
MRTTLSSRVLVAVAGAGSAATLAGAFAFQYIGGMAPCALCLWQRWPHAAAVLIMVLALLVPNRWLMALGAVAALTTSGIAGFHMGVEYGWWQGLQSCSGGSIAGISMNDLLNPNAAVAAPVRCDEVPWSLFGLSMAGWNMVLSLGLTGVWIMAARRA